jgi:hypothetical protein
LIKGDQNAKVGNDNSQHERSIGREGYGRMNENGERLANVCSTNGFVIGRTLFKHRDIHKVSWNYPNNRDNNQIYHVIVNGKWKRSLRDTISYTGADINNDHHIVIAKLRLKLKKITNSKATKRKVIKTKRLNDDEVRKKFCLEIGNRFKVLEYLDKSEELSLEKKWENIKQVNQLNAEQNIGFRNKNDEQWLSQDTWKIIEVRRKLKEQTLNT